MENNHHPRFTSAEIASLWGQYQMETLSLCVNRYMHHKITTPEISKIFDYSIHLGEQHKNSVESFLSKENFPIPHGFTEQDVNLEAPRLFSDEFCLSYLLQMTIHGLSSYGISLSVTTRKDIRNYFVECNTSSMELYNQIIDLLLEMGIFQRPPHVSTPPGIEFVQDKSFMNAWIGERRLLNVIEISEVYFNLVKNMTSKTLFLAYHQVTQTKEVKKFVSTSIDLFNKHIEELGAKLQRDNLPTPSSYEDQITSSTTSP